MLIVVSAIMYVLVVSYFNWEFSFFSDDFNFWLLFLDVSLYSFCYAVSFFALKFLFNEKHLG